MYNLEMYSEAQKQATYRWNAKNREKMLATRMRSYYRLKAYNQAFKELVGLLQVI
jgi:hypothetical protein